jgi:hypothetical protein
MKTCTRCGHDRPLDDFALPILDGAQHAEFPR